MLLLTPALLFGLFVMWKFEIQYRLNEWDKVNDWTYLWEEMKQNKHRYLHCKCSCWKDYRVRLSYLMNWRSQRCKCCASKNARTKHWMYFTRFYKIYSWIIRRCNNINDQDYHNYWWRWIKCLRNSFEEFKDDMYWSYLKHTEDYWVKQTTIDRIDNNWNYCKDNCKRSTHKEQCNNLRKNIKTRFWYTAKELADMYWLTEHTIRTYIVRYKDKVIEYLESRKK